jgi:predicted porin
MVMKILVILMFIIFCNNALGSEKDVGTSAFTFLKISKGARALSIGGAFSAVSDDVTALFWNPAGLTQLKNTQVSFLYLPYIQGMRVIHAAVAFRKRKAGVGVAYAQLSHKELQGYDAEGNPTSVFAAKDSFGLLALSLKMTKFFHIGVCAKYLRGEIEKETATTIGYDLGALLTFGNMKVAAVIQNRGKDTKFIKETFSLPETYRMGISLRHSNLLLSADYVLPRDGSSYVCAGAEFLIENIALRAGYKGGPAHKEISNFSVGIGAKTSKISLNYAFSPFSHLGKTHAISLLLEL